MSTAHKAVAFYGVYFDNHQAVEAFLDKLSVTDYYDEIMTDKLGYDCLNSFTGDEWVLGIGMELGIPLSHYEALWAKLLPENNQKPRAILEVKTY